MFFSNLSLILSLLVGFILFILVGSMSFATLFVTNLLPNFTKFLFAVLKKIVEFLLGKKFLKNKFEFLKPANFFGFLLGKKFLKNPFGVPAKNLFVLF